jgi:hypothetical protein
MTVTGNLISRLAFVFFLFLMIACASTKFCEPGTQYASMVRGNQIEEYRLVIYIKNELPLEERPAFSKCFVEAYGQEGTQFLDKLFGASDSPFYDKGIIFGKGISSDSISRFDLVVFVMDSLTDNESLAFEAGFIDAYGQEGHRYLQSVYNITDDPSYALGFEIGKKLKAEEIKPFHAVLNAEKLEGETARDNFRIGFISVYGEDARNAVDLILEASLAEQFDLGISIGERLIRRETEPYNVRVYIEQNIYLLSPAKVLGFKSGFISAFEDLKEGEQVFLAIWMSIGIRE